MRLQLLLFGFLLVLSSGLVFAAPKEAIGEEEKGIANNPKCSLDSFLPFWCEKNEWCVHTENDCPNGPPPDLFCVKNGADMAKKCNFKCGKDAASSKCDLQIQATTENFKKLCEKCLEPKMREQHGFDCNKDTSGDCVTTFQAAKGEGEKDKEEPAPNDFGKGYPDPNECKENDKPYYCPSQKKCVSTLMDCRVSKELCPAKCDVGSKTECAESFEKCRPSQFINRHGCAGQTPVHCAKEFAKKNVDKCVDYESDCGLNKIYCKAWETYKKENPTKN